MFTENYKNSMHSDFFSPSSVVIIGASEASGKIGNSILKNLSDFSGAKYAVNPKGGSAYGVDFSKSISQLEKIPDMAVIAIPAKYVEQSLRECGEKKIKNIVIISAGFKEIGNIEEEKKLKTIADKYDINILGPNCLGFLNPHKHLNLSFASSIGVKKGNIALVSQSGAMAVAVMDWAQEFEMGFSHVISMGNKSDINEGDILEYLEKDEKTKVIVLYLEDIVDGRSFYEKAKKVTKTKPVIIVKSGVSKKGALAASSHTGALAGEKEILYTAFSQCGVHSTGSLKDVFLWSEMFSLLGEKNIPETVLLITNAGGPGVMAVDNAEKYNINLFEPSVTDEEILKKNLPMASSMKNPLDILGDATRKEYSQVLENTLNLKNNDFAYCILLTPQTVTDSENIADEIIQFQKNNPEKVIMTSFMGGKSVEKARKKLKKSGILHFNYPKEALKAYKKAIIQKKWEKESSSFYPQLLCSFPQNLFEIRSRIEKESVLCSAETTAFILRSFKIPFAEELCVSQKSEISSVWNQLQKGENIEVVMKISSPDIAHKTDIGGVHLHISTEKEAENAYDLILQAVRNNVPNAQVRGVTFQRMLPVSREVFVGMTRDENFGEVIIFGFGGIYLNIFRDISRRIGPVSKNEIQKMVKEIKSYPILKGARGQESIDFESLENILFQLSCLFYSIPEIVEIDINPIFCTEKESIIIDAKIFI